ncbi:MAG: hypothetical protein HYZ00_00490 [Candidatus Hydrogenedentes bacterium]|nr:hypothetical protein [Candidatus Hydrogenedentota bacterium]
MYRTLNPAAIVATLDQLDRRIKERFPDSSLSRVNAELLGAARAASATADRIAKPWPALRFAEAALIAGLVSGIAWILYHARLGAVPFDLAQLVTISEPAVNLAVLVVLAILSLAGIERRMKRARALEAIHELRAIAHVIDMHQLTKDPERPLGRVSTPSSPPVNLTPFELSRYLDYCSEMLSLAGKVAALFVQKFHDPVALSAVNDLESLTTGLSQKIWQKLMIQQALLGPEAMPTSANTEERA